MIFKPGTGFVSSNYVTDTKKLNPERVHFMRLFNPHVGSLRSPTWGFQEHNSYRVANMENDNMHYKYKTFKSTTRTELHAYYLFYGHICIGVNCTTRTELHAYLSHFTA